MTQIVRFQVERDRESSELSVVTPLRSAPSGGGPAASGERSPKPCSHDRHVGWCPSCQRAQLARWRSQLAAVSV